MKDKHLLNRTPYGDLSLRYILKQRKKKNLRGETDVLSCCIQQMKHQGTMVMIAKTQERFEQCQFSLPIALKFGAGR